jgi:WD40 repeat protein
MRELIQKEIATRPLGSAGNRWISWSSNGDKIAVYTGDGIKIFDRTFSNLLADLRLDDLRKDLLGDRWIIYGIRFFHTLNKLAILIESIIGEPIEGVRRSYVRIIDCDSDYTHELIYQTDETLNDLIILEETNTLITTGYRIKGGSRITFWDYVNQREMYVIQGQDSSRQVDILFKEHLLVAHYGSTPHIRYWDLSTKLMVDSFAFPDYVTVWSVSVRQSDSMVAFATTSGGYVGIRALYIPQATILGQHDGHQGLWVNCSQDGLWLASGDMGGVVNIWNMTTYALEMSLSVPIPPEFNNINSAVCIAFSPDSQLLAFLRRDGKLSLWEM